MNRIMDTRHERDAVLVGEGHNEVRDSLLASARAENLTLGVEGDTEAALHEVGDRAKEARRAAKWWIAMRPRISVCVGDGFHDSRWRGLIGITDSQIEQMDTAGARLGLELIEPGKDIRRQRR